MPNTLQEILEAEKAARRQTEDAQEYKEKTVVETAALCEQIISKKMDDAREKAEEIRAQINKRAEQNVEQIKNDSALAEQRLNESFRLNGERWADELYRRVLEG